MVASRLFRGFMYNLVQSFLIEINTFMFSHFTDGKTGTETALCSRSQRVSGMRKRVQGAAPPISGSLCPLPVRGSGREPLPWPGGGVLPAASPLRSGRRSCGRASACRVDGKHRLTRRARNMRQGSTCLGPSRPRSDLVCSGDSRL